MTEINLKKNILVSGSFRILLLFVSFLFSWISARYLGVELKGKISYLITLAAFFWMVLDLGLYRSFPYLVRKFPANTGVLFSWSLLTFVAETCLLLVVGFTFLPVWSAVLGFEFSPLYMLFFVFYITLTKSLMQLQSLFLGLNDILRNSLAFLLNSVIALVVILVGYLYFQNTDRLVFVMIATLSGLVLSIVYLLLRGKVVSHIKKLDFRFVLSAYSFGFRVFLSSLFIMLLIRADIVLVKRMLGFSEVGIYSIGAHIVDMLQMASNLVGGLLLVKLTDTACDVAKWLIMKKILMVFFVFLSVANLGFVLLGKTILSVMFGWQFVPVYSVYLWLIPASYGLSFGSLFNQYLNSRGFPLVSIVLPAIAFVLNIGLNLVFIPLWGINGAAIATSIAYAFWFVMIIGYEQKYTQNRMLKHLIPSIRDWKDLLGEARSTYQSLRTRVAKR